MEQMFVSASNWAQEEAKEHLATIVAPRPVALISSCTSGSQPCETNVAAFSSVAPVCNAPPLVLFSCGSRVDSSPKTTSRNVLASGEFVMNFLPAALIAKLAAYPEGAVLSDLAVQERLGVTAAPSKYVRPDRVKEAIAVLECRLVRAMNFGAGRSRVDLLIGEVLGAWIPPSASAEKHSLFLGAGALSIDLFLTQGGVAYWPVR